MLRRSALLGAALLPLLAAASARAQDLPPRPVRMVIPYAPGGTTDILARLLAQHFQAEFGQPLIVETRPGAGGTVGTAQVAASPPDGTTLVMGTPGTHATATAFYPNLPYAPARDFAPVALVANVPNVVVVNPPLPVNDVAELIAAARARRPCSAGSRGWSPSANTWSGSVAAPPGPREPPPDEERPEKFRHHSDFCLERKGRRGAVDAQHPGVGLSAAVADLLGPG